MSKKIEDTAGQKSDSGKKSQQGNPLLRILGYLRPYWRIIALSILLLLASVAADLTIPTLIQRIIDYGCHQDLTVIATALYDWCSAIQESNHWKHFPCRKSRSELRRQR